MFYKDDVFYMDVVDFVGVNGGFYLRLVYCKESILFDLEGFILEDVCCLDWFVLNGVDVNIKFYW